jgi:hypothetical protein
MEHGLASVHAAGESGLVEDVTADGASAPSLDRASRFRRAGESADLSAVVGQALQERAPHEAAATGQERRTGHARGYRSRRPTNRPPNRTKYSTPEPTVTTAAANMAYWSG